MLAHSHVGASSNNMGQEVYYKWLKVATAGKKSVSLPFFLGAMCEYAEDRARDEMCKVMQHKKEGECEELYKFQTKPVVSMKIWEDVQQLDAESLAWICLSTASGECIAKYNKIMGDIVDGYYEEYPDAPDDVKLIKLLECARRKDGRQRMALKELHEVIMPTMNYLQRVKNACKERHAVAVLDDEQQNEVRIEVGTRLEMFENICLGAQEASMRDMIRLSEDFVLLTVLPEKWSTEVRHKCSCPVFFKEAQCEHAVALSMFLYPAEVCLPVDSDVRRVNQRRRLKRGRSAADAKDDDTNEQRKKPAPEVRPEPTLKIGALSDSEEAPCSSSPSPVKQVNCIKDTVSTKKVSRFLVDVA